MEVTIVQGWVKKNWGSVLNENILTKKLVNERENSLPCVILTKTFRIANNRNIATLINNSIVNASLLFSLCFN